MKTHLVQLIIYLSWLFFLISCWDSSSVKTQLSSESFTAQEVFCNPIKESGFEGVLAVNTSGSWIHEAESAILKFRDVPDEFKNIDYSYIQLFPFSYQNNLIKREKRPLEMDMYNLNTHVFALSTEYIDHALIDGNNYDIDDFFFDNIFIIKDIAGWQGLIIGLFNDIDKALIVNKVLNPPFDANPHIYKTQHADNPRLSSLHPFNIFIPTTKEDEHRLFLSKARDACLMLPGISFDFYSTI